MVEPVKSILLVDLDGLGRGLAASGGEGMGERLAERIDDWSDAIESGELIEPADTPHAITVRRCYVSSASADDAREAFAHAGFELVECDGQAQVELCLAIDAMDAAADADDGLDFILMTAAPDLTPLVERLHARGHRVAIYCQRGDRGRLPGRRRHGDSGGQTRRASRRTQAAGKGGCGHDLCRPQQDRSLRPRGSCGDQHSDVLAEDLRRSLPLSGERGFPARLSFQRHRQERRRTPERCRPQRHLPPGGVRGQGAGAEGPRLFDQRHADTPRRGIPRAGTLSDQRRRHRARCRARGAARRLDRRTGGTSGQDDPPGAQPATRSRKQAGACARPAAETSRRLRRNRPPKTSRRTSPPRCAVPKSRPPPSRRPRRACRSAPNRRPCRQRRRLRRRNRRSPPNRPPISGRRLPRALPPRQR